VFTTGHTELVSGFDLRNNTLALAELFQNVRPGQDGAPLIAFSVVSDYAAGDPNFGNRSGVSLGDALFVSSSTGTVSLTMDYPGNHTVRLIARTGTGPAERTRPVELLSWTVRVQEPGAFGLRQGHPDGCGQEYVDELQAQINRVLRERAPRDDRHDANTTIVLPGINTSRCSFSEIFDHPATDGAGDPQVAFRVAVEHHGNGSAASLGDDPFNTDKGRLSLSLKQHGKFVVKLQATTARPDGVLAVLNLTSVALDVRHPDTYDNSTGADRSCSGHGQVTEDGSSAAPLVQNDRYTCICNDSWTGVDCEVPPPTAASAANAYDSGTTVGSILGAIVFIMLAALIAFRVQLYRLKHRPVDVTAMQQKVMEDLGLAAATNFGQNEVGITLAFDRCPVDAATAALPDRFKRELIAALAKAAPQLKAALRTVKLTSAGAKSVRVLAVMPKSGGLDDGPAAKNVEMLARKAAKGKLAAAGFNLVDASVAVPQRVPREINRSTLTRVRLLGEGAFGEVHQYQLEEKGSAMSFFVAAKSIKAGAAGAEEARSDLMREATLGALLAHRNVITVVGICTTPRDVPALLLLVF
jgi:hypothetical protein